MADVITLSDDDFAGPKDNAAKQWDQIFSKKPDRACRNGDSKSKRPSERPKKSSNNASSRPSDRSSGHSSRAAPSRPARRRSSSSKSVIELDDSDGEANGSSEEASARRPDARASRGQRSEAAAKGVKKARGGKGDEPASARHGLNAGGYQQTNASRGKDDVSRPKRVAGDSEETTPTVKRARLTEAEPCDQGVEEVCKLLTPLLSGDELRLVAKVRRRHAAVLALATASSGRRQHLLGVTRQCADRLRAEPDRCFTVLRNFLEQLDQIKLVASSTQSRAAAPPSSAAAGAKTSTAEKKKPSVVVNGTSSASASASTSAPASASASAEAEAEPEGEKDARRHRRHLAKLEKTLRRLEREIIRQDEQEVDWEDGVGSSYMVGARLKRRYVQVYRYYCRLVGAEEEAQRLDARRIRFDGTRYPEINRRIEKFVNRTCEFPDFKDVLNLIETVNQRCRLRLGPGAMHDQAKEAFVRLGTLLQKRRRAALAESMDALAGAEEWRHRDPAAGDASLGGRLAENAASGRERLNQVFGEFVERQEAAAAERRKKGAGSDEDEDEGEEEETEDAEESEVTDEELERQAPKTVDSSPVDSDTNNDDVNMSDDERGEDLVDAREECDGEAQHITGDEGNAGAEADSGGSLDSSQKVRSDEDDVAGDRQTRDETAVAAGEPGKMAPMADGSRETTSTDGENGGTGSPGAARESSDKLGGHVSDEEQPEDTPPSKDSSDALDSENVMFWEGRLDARGKGCLKEDAEGGQNGGLSVDGPLSTTGAPGGSEAVGESDRRSPGVENGRSLDCQSPGDGACESGCVSASSLERDSELASRECGTIEEVCLLSDDN